ncbi:hypothetical protein BDZ90DRAFT_230082 [Jaminaea rosea]|uniref:Pre-mRNA-splicing factor CWC2 n=1 Tax=Jaminaea rosea TaxID=1569628 RepID=A0A316V0L1_9BASI|nr:hypothetical protein BDZ90DRAFT_230082 [Jaminaea rosea]PWN31086.1 hypothetical protein BDZ90DRAFT_230082 [Jaminaea rosea]
MSSPTVQMVASTSSSSSSASASTSALPTIVSKSRPARKQITAHRLEQIRNEADKSNQTGVSYNIWYNKWSGGDRDDHVKHKSETRCDIARDAGYTRGDALQTPFICLQFARGCCYLGADCTFLHRLPRTQVKGAHGEHTSTMDQGKDIFGREKGGDYRDDMGGVGSIQRVNRTLYIGKIHEEEEDLRKVSTGGGANGVGPQWRDGGRTVKGGKSVGQARRDVAIRNDNGKVKSAGNDTSSNDLPNLPPAPVFPVTATEKVLRRHFGEFGPLERVRVLTHRGCAFVTYSSEASAQFAKEAMSNQSLDHGEILNVRWATEDPNPTAKKRERARMEGEGRKRVEERMTDEQREYLAARARLEAGLPEPEEDGEHDGKRLRIEAGEGEEMDEEEMARLIEENRRNWEEMDRQDEEERKAQAAPAPVVPNISSASASASTAASPPAATAPTGFFSSDALGGLAYIQALRKQQGQEQQPASAKQAQPKPAAAKTAAPTGGLGGLAAYGSDSEDED